MTRYHPLLVALHWLIALGIFLMLFVGGPMLADLDNSDPTKLTGMQGHMTLGIVVLILMIVRLVTRVRTKHPPDADIGNVLLNRVAKWMHWVLYLFVFLMIASGIGMALSAGLFDIVVRGSGEPLPESLHIYPPRVAHGVIAKLLMLLVVGHVLAALYHQIIRKDRLLSRMWFGKRS